MGWDERKRRTAPLGGVINEPQPSTSKCPIDFDTRDINRYKTKAEKGLSLPDQQQMKQKPPIGPKLKDDSQFKSRSGPCPMSKTPKRKVDDLSPTIKYSYDFPNETDSQSCQCEPVPTSQTSLSNIKPVAMTTKLSVIQTPSITCQTSIGKNYDDLRTPEKISHAKVHPYRKPASLSVTTNNTLIGNKRLPSPKVLVTGSKKPEPTDYKKRCLDLNLQENSLESSDNFVGLNPLDEIMSDDLHDLIKPLSPSDFEAYLTSLSNKASKKLGASKLDDIPTTKCSFFLGDESDSKYLEERSSIEPKEWEKTIKDVTSAKTQCLSSDSSIDNKKQLTPQRSEETHVRKLFVGPEPEQEVGSVSVRHEVSKDIETNFTNVRTSYYTTSEKSHESLPIKDEVGNVNKTDLLQPENVAFSDLHTQKSLSREATKSCSGESTTTSSSRNITQSCAKKREMTLNTLSIPCSIGGDNTALNTLVSNLECMDIDENNPISSLPSSVDNEVENHFKQELFQNGFSKNKAEQSDATEKAAENCDTSPNRDLSLCKQLLRREFQQNVKNVSGFFFVCYCCSLFFLGFF
jgi:hypothetical protein